VGVTYPTSAKFQQGFDLRAIRCFLLDMDGTVYLGEKLLPGAFEFLEFLRQRKLSFLFLTNNSSRHRDQYVEKLQRLGISVQADQVFTSGEATARYLKAEQPEGRIYLVGTPALEDELQKFGFELVEKNPDFAVLGFDTTLTYEKLSRLCHFVRNGVPYIATHPDLNCPTESGPIPDIGAMMAFVEASTGKAADVIVGKPHRPIVDAILKKTGLQVEELCMVGDRLYTDIALGEHGMATILVLSGETRAQDLTGSTHKPDLVLPDLQGLLEWMLEHDLQ
jgi:4-nitrophenyl phosphatase